MNYENLTLDLRSYDKEVKQHSHDYHQLVLPVDGALQIAVGQQEGKTDQRCSTLIAAGEEHSFASDGENRFIVADIPAALAPEFERLPAFIQLDPALSHYVRFLHQQLLTDPQATQSQRQMLLLLIQLIQERHGNMQGLDRRLLVARDYLDDHFHQRLTLPQVASIAALSPRRLNELFRQQLGMTPIQYLTEKRMQQAWQLLEQGQLSTQQVADQVGYSNLSAFSDRFRKHFGHSPRYFRQSGK